MLRRASLRLSRKVVALSLTAGISITAGISMTPSASADSAPDSESNALGLRLDPIIQLSGTHAGANDTQGSSSADVVKVLGASPLASTGGWQAGNGSQQGALVDTGVPGAARAKVAPWSTSASSTAAHRRAEANAALASFVLLNNSTLFIDILRSNSTADHDTATNTSTGSASSDAAVVGAGNLVAVDVLHSEGSSERGAATWLLGINGTNFGTSEQLGGLCSLALAPVASASCLNVVGGIGTNNAASLLDAGLLDVVHPGVLQLNTTTNGAGDVAPVIDGARFTAHERGAAASPTQKVRGAGAGRLPRTGAATVALAALGLLFVAFGLVTVVASRARLAIRAA